MGKQMKGYLYRRLFSKKFAVQRKPEGTATSQLLHAMESNEPEFYPKLKKGERFPKFIVTPIKHDEHFPVVSHMKGIRYPLIRPYAYADIRWSTANETYVYHIIEPGLTEEEKRVFERLKEGLIQTINISLENIRKRETLVDFLEERIQKLLEDYGIVLSSRSYIKIMYYVYRDFIGLNDIEPIMQDPYIEDISCDGVGIPVYVIHQKLGSLETSIVYKNEEQLRDFVVKMAERTDRYISYAKPLLDGTLPDGSRIQASFAGDVTTKGPTFSIRKFKEMPFTPVDVVSLNTAGVDMLAYLWFLVENGRNILIAGGTSTGKTTFLNTLSLFIPPDAKIISIEDTRELSLPHDNWIPGVSRVGFSGTKIGEVTMFDLLKESFRQNPDYLIVGEVRGKEAAIMFQGMASGHSGLSSMHAGSVDDVIKRLETEPINLSPSLVETLDIVVIMVRAKEKGASSRRVKEIIEIEDVSIQTGKAATFKAFSWSPATDAFESGGESPLIRRVSEEKGISVESIYAELEIKKKILRWLVGLRPVNWRDVAKYISMYYKDKTRIIELVERTAYA